MAFILNARIIFSGVGIASGKRFDYSRLIAATDVSFDTDKFDHPIAVFPNDWTMRDFVEKALSSDYMSCRWSECETY